MLKSSGKYLDNLPYPGRVSNLEINFSEGETLDWTSDVYKKLPERIGVYLVIRTITFAEKSEEEIIYVGLANGEGGLKGRHKKHEKNEQFNLFNASKLRIYYADGVDKDDPGKVALLERIMIYAHEPILNDDIKRSKPSSYFVIENAIEKLTFITNSYKALMQSDKLFDEDLTKFNNLKDQITDEFNRTKTLEANYKTSKNKKDKNLFKVCFRFLKKEYTSNEYLKEINNGYYLVNSIHSVIYQLSEKRLG